MWLGGIALIVFCAAGVAAFVGWIPDSAGKPAASPIAQKAPAAPRAARVVAVCTQCGVVQSVQEIDTKGEGSGITVRFDDGSSRVITEPGTTAWRAGDRVKVIDGVIQSNA